ncbi:intradiol ring-cleavage dioxygenase [Amycolatopsis sp. 195334CR]|uniref:intradiol ring-cleavage dioxygenase n=1 Tax=Amycolatopsis sp. 195334CR TaxID=2814588 RepID=UPI001A8FAA59|nr:intradiol ring-cleavage dioxygenase [Amycolatopsis sp. 195334CR]MBN6039525.1 intradiol ring-cleavage dioxygenase [Amycolatopsis sp. 195334CR]
MTDHHEGQRVSRRRLLAGISSLSLTGLLAACSTSEPQQTAAASTTAAATEDVFSGAGTCVLTPETTQGPYYFDADKVRADIREERPGTTLRLALKLQDSETCAALPNAVVEIWHCDAAGLYSGAEARSSGSGGPPAGAPPAGGPPPGGTGAGDGMADLTPTDDQRYLRGAQVTNAEGVVGFTTIWPGWYRGRTVHIHVMVHVSNERVLTSQLMFDEALNSAVFENEPYAAHTGRDTFNEGDSIFEESMLLKVTRQADGYLGALVLSADSDRDGR